MGDGHAEPALDVPTEAEAAMAAKAAEYERWLEERLAPDLAAAKARRARRVVAGRIARVVVWSIAYDVVPHSDSAGLCVSADFADRSDATDQDSCAACNTMTG